VITKYRAGALNPQDKLRFEDHLAQCSGCRNYLEQTRVIISLTGSLGPTPFGWRLTPASLSIPRLEEGRPRIDVPPPAIFTEASLGCSPWAE
jgi:hypothetical protein